MTAELLVIDVIWTSVAEQMMLRCCIHTLLQRFRVHRWHIP